MVDFVQGNKNSQRVENVVNNMKQKKDQELMDKILETSKYYSSQIR